MTTPSMRRVTDEELKRAASVLVTTALRLTGGERFVVVGDLESAPLLNALEAAGREASADVSSLRLDLLRSQSTNHSGERPHKVLPDGVRRAMLAAQASVFVAASPPLEAGMREQLLHIVGACKIRHAHMAGTDPSSFVAGLAIDHERMAEQGRAIERRLQSARELTTESDDGTALVVTAPPDRRWTARLGQVAPGEAVVFPAGSLYACPASVSGRFVATASVGELSGAREGVLGEPLVFDVEDGRVTKVSSERNPHLVRDVEAMLAASPSAGRVGLVVLGVNTGIGEPTSNVAVDQHRPGLHVIFGDSPELADASGSARPRFVACQARSSVRVDGSPVVEHGRLVPT